ncbi:MAG TPA: 2-hydroxychromene-2-carboxylate isomerase [Gammaproteobacteria bacterium]|nr:2-hydroxychromene-2-carboxylate isomerase [Gammaproteobacteria bacterium]
MSTQAKWYFDFVSPFSYLQFHRLDSLPSALDYKMVPVLFAGLLKHWEHKGPAEIPPKRLDTYRHCQWLANQLGVPFQVPQAHPFNPLPYLRLCLSLDTSHEVVGTIFDYIWAKGAPAHTEAGIVELGNRLGIRNLEAELDSAKLKQQLRANTEHAIAEGVYGVPTFVMGRERFWGLDQMEMLVEWLANPEGMAQIATKRFAELPSGV